MRGASISLLSFAALAAVFAVLVGPAGATVRDGAPICTDALISAGLPCVIPDTPPATPTPVSATAPTMLIPTPVSPLHNCMAPPGAEKSCPLVKLAAFPSVVKKGTKMTFHAGVFDSSKLFIYNIELHVGQTVSGKLVTTAGAAISDETSAKSSLTWKAKKGKYIVCAVGDAFKSDAVAIDCGLLTVN